MAITAARAPAAEPGTDDVLVGEQRARFDQERLDRRARIVFATLALTVGGAAAASALLLERGPSFSPVLAVLFVALYAVVSHVEFEVGTGAAIPSQLVLVPMLFALPIGLVPALVAAALLVRALVDDAKRLRDVARAFALVGSAAHALGPVLVIALAGGLPLRWGAWPVYAAALGAQFAFDFGNTIATGVGHRVRIRTLIGVVGLVYAIDAALAPIGLAVAFATRDHTWLAVLVLPLVGLLRVFARERQRRIDHALQLSDAYRGTAFLLGDVVEADDAYTGSHSRHVVDLVLGVCDELSLDEAERRDAEFVALLHDVGKIRIPAAIIDKPGPLDADERAVIETHTIEGEQMLARVGGLLGRVGKIVRSCHERWDGAGYPDRLVGEAIPLVARVVCACDAFSAMTTDRPYRKALTRETALAELERCAGTQFDPRVVAALVRVEARV